MVAFIKLEYNQTMPKEAKNISSLSRVVDEFGEEQVKEWSERHSKIFRKRLSDKLGYITDCLQNYFILHGLEVASIGTKDETQSVAKTDATGKTTLNPNLRIRKLRLRAEYAAANRINAQFDYHDMEFDGTTDNEVHRGAAEAFGKAATHIWKTEKLGNEMKTAIIMARSTGELIVKSDRKEFRAINPIHFFPAINATNWKEGEVTILAEPIARVEALEYVSEEELENEIGNESEFIARFATTLNPSKLLSSVYWEKGTPEERKLLERVVTLEGGAFTSRSMFTEDSLRNMEEDDAPILRISVYDRKEKKLFTYINDKLVDTDPWNDDWEIPFDRVLEFTDGLTKAGMSDIGAMLPYGRFESNILDLHKRQLERSASLPTFIDRRFAESMRVGADGTMAIFDRNTLGGGRNPEQSIFSPQIKSDISNANNLFNLVDQKLWQIGNVAPNQVGNVLNNYETAEAVSRSIGAVEATIRERNIRNQEDLIVPAMQRYMMYKFIWGRKSTVENISMNVRSSEGVPNKIIIAQGVSVTDQGDYWLYRLDPSHQYYEDKLNLNNLISMIDEMEAVQQPIVEGAGITVEDILNELDDPDLKSTDIQGEVDDLTGDLVIREVTPEPEGEGVVKPKEKWSTKLTQLKEKGIDGIIIPQEIKKVGIGLELSAIVPTVDEKMMRAQFAVSMIAILQQSNPALAYSLSMYAAKTLGIDVGRDFSLDSLKETMQEKEKIGMAQDMAQIESQMAAAQAQGTEVGSPSAEPPALNPQDGGTDTVTGQMDNMTASNNQGMSI